MIKNFLLIPLLCFSSIVFAQTQSEMNDDAYKEYLKADTELNSIYQKVLKEYDSDTVFINSLKNAQRIWIQFRDAEVIVKFPHREQGYYGSVMPMCWSFYLKDLTDERIKKLQDWLNGTEEGDVCSGSVKITN